MGVCDLVKDDTTMRFLVLTIVLSFCFTSGPASAADDLANELINEIYKDAPKGVTPPKSRDPQLLKDLQQRLESMDELIFEPLRKSKATKSYDINLHIRNLENPRSAFCDDLRETGHDMEMELKARMEKELHWWNPVDMYKLAIGILWARQKREDLSELARTPNHICSRRG